MEYYTYQLEQQGKIFELEMEFEKKYPKIKVSASLHFNKKDIFIIISDRNFHFIKAYVANDFDCEPFKDEYLKPEYKKLPKSGQYCNDQEIRQCYLRFMKKNFEHYYDDYKNYQLNAIEEDLGCSKRI